MCYSFSYHRAVVSLQGKHDVNFTSECIYYLSCYLHFFSTSQLAESTRDKDDAEMQIPTLKVNSLSVCLSACVSVCLYVCLSVCLCYVRHSNESY